MDEDDPEKPSKLNQRVLTLRKFEAAQHDPILKAPFLLFNSHVKLNLDQKLDLVERQAILKQKKETDEYKELVEVLRNEVAMKEEMI
jgi:hypothetical protein